MYEPVDDWYLPREPIHLNEDDHLDTEDCHLVVEDGTDLNHAVSLRQLNKVKQDILSYVINLRNKYVNSFSIVKVSIQKKK